MVIFTIISLQPGGRQHQEYGRSEAWMLPLGVTTGSVTVERELTAFPESEDPGLLLSTACL